MNNYQEFGKEWEAELMKHSKKELIQLYKARCENKGLIEQTLWCCDKESTRSPYWLILDPQQNMSCDIHCLAGQISGLFFSRKDAQEYLDGRRYNFSKTARVYCLSGYHSKKYDDLCKELGI